MKKYLKLIEIILAMILLISFFLPWVYNGWGVSWSGLTLPLILFQYPAQNVMTVNSDLWIKIFCYLFFLIYIIPVLSLIIIIQGIRKKNIFVYSLTAGILIYALLIYNIFAWEHFVFHEILYGGYITLVAGLLLIITSVIKYKNNIKNQELKK